MKTLSLVSMVLLVMSHAVFAGVMVESSRIVFSAANPEQSLMLSNNNDYPVLVQTWIDDGAPDGTPEKATNSPVIPLPGLFRLEPGEKKYLRLLATQMPLPVDRESLYWLNIYEIPPTDTHLPVAGTFVKVAVRLQLKLFYRPVHLPLPVEDVPGRLRFTLLRQPGLSLLKVQNPTPYYTSFSSAVISGSTGTEKLNVGMVAPFSDKTVPLKGTQGTSSASIHYSIINDEGNDTGGHSDLRTDGRTRAAISGVVMADTG
ncbi:molecular chaperone [Pseudenterobacter timonensis]|uniref:Molecular chaperone n=1 Tax=Pseudenterobacter timonensis TaxID=1755099 RepID=A0AAE4IUC0_9ENTR|nr:molecular chaperone [Pseudenterobacter timonensis]MDR9889182.1 molecular chaperone [Pseudenterobacter timonensis]